MKSNSKQRRTDWRAEIASLFDYRRNNPCSPRALNATHQCYSLIAHLSNHTHSAFRAHATDALENAAAYLELLADDPHLRKPILPGLSMPVPIYNQAVIQGRTRTAAKASGKPVTEVEWLQALYDLPSPPDPAARKSA